MAGGSAPGKLPEAADEGPDRDKIGAYVSLHCLAGDRYE
jgi:hypothetical protein